jgi:hypothetical protein
MKNPYKHIKKLKKWAAKNKYYEICPHLREVEKAMQKRTNPLLSDLQLLTPFYFENMVAKYGNESVVSEFLNLTQKENK